MSRFSLVPPLLVLASAIVMAPRNATAQVATSFAQLNGTIRDTSRGALNGVAIAVRNSDTNQEYRTFTNAAGFYALPSLPPCTYQIEASLSGFSTGARDSVVIRVGETATIEMELAIEAKRDSVTVSAQATSLDRGKSEASDVVDTRQIQALPNSGRLFTDFALLTPGVATGRTSLQSTVTEFEVTRISFGGMRDLSNQIMVDGADTINTVTGSQRATPPQDSVSEFRVVSNSFGADYGRALGGVVNIVTRSGTNVLHGALYEYLENDTLNARSLLQPAPDPNTMRQNQFGASLGGPLVKNRTFFFANYEAQRRALAPTFPAELSANIGFFNAAKAALGLPAENLNVLQTGNRDSGFIKLDHEINDSHRLSIRYNVENGRSLNLLAGNTVDGGGVAAPSDAHNAFIQDSSLVANLTTTPGANLVNTFLVQWARRTYDFPAVSGQPALDIPNELMFGHNFGAFDYIGESRVQLSNATSWVRGRHMLRFGADVNLLEDKVTWPGFTPMRIVLPGANCLVQFANYVNPGADLAGNPALSSCPLPSALNGTPVVFWGAPVGSGPLTPGYTPPAIPTNWKNAYLPSMTDVFNTGLDHRYFGVFAEDQWRATRTLTVNYGVRRDVETGLGKFINPDYRNFGPRLGLAFAPGGKIVIPLRVWTLLRPHQSTFRLCYSSGASGGYPWCEPARGGQERRIRRMGSEPVDARAWRIASRCGEEPDPYRTGSRAIPYGFMSALLHGRRGVDRPQQQDSICRTSQLPD